LLPKTWEKSYQALTAKDPQPPTKKAAVTGGLLGETTTLPADTNQTRRHRIRSTCINVSD
jgi:hypothetical protein